VCVCVSVGKELNLSGGGILRRGEVQDHVSEGCLGEGGVESV
jgi:hypothetical protein